MPVRLKACQPLNSKRTSESADGVPQARRQPKILTAERGSADNISQSREARPISLLLQRQVEIRDAAPRQTMHLEAWPTIQAPCDKRWSRSGSELSCGQQRGAVGNGEEPREVSHVGNAGCVIFFVFGAVLEVVAMGLLLSSCQA